MVSARRLARAVIAPVICLSLSACATCERHPVICATAAAVIVGSAVAIAEAHHREHTDRVVMPRTSPCDPRRTCP